MMSEPRTTPRRLRVVIVGPSLLHEIGGQAVQADLLRRNWEGDAEVDASFIPADPQFPRALRWAESIPFLRTIIRLPIYWTALWRGTKGADVVHAFSASYWSFLLAPAPCLLVARLRGAKTIVNYRSGEARDHLRRSRLARRLLRRFDRIITPSAYLVEVFREFGLRASDIPNVVDMGQISFRLRKPLRPVLVCTRSLEPYYGIDVVVRAFAEIKKQYPAARLLLVGGGSCEPMLRALASELHVTDVTFAGAVGRDVIGQYYAQADIFINGSRLDNMPVSVLEAFAAGTPVVTTAAEGIKFIVAHERTGMMCPVDDWQGLAGNVVRLLNDSDLGCEIARNAFHQSNQYRWESVRAKWLSVYRALAPARVAPGQEHTSEAASAVSARSGNSTV